MRWIYLIVVLCVVQFSCSRGRDLDDLDYVKVVVLKEADSLTSFNKGVGLGGYAYIDLRSDSFIYRNWSGDWTGEEFKQQITYSTYSGRIKDSSKLSPFLKLIQLVRRYREGDINSSSIPYGAMYCGPEYYLEFKDSRGRYYYSFVLDGNDTIEEFDSSFAYFSRFSSDFTKIDNKALNGDSIAVATLDVLGRYREMEEPHIPFDCENEIEIDKLVGSWRTLSTLTYPEKNTYYKIVFLNDGTCTYEFMFRGVIKHRYSTAKYEVDKKRVRVFIKNKSYTTELKIVRLTDYCLELTEVSRKDTVRYNRL